MNKVKVTLGARACRISTKIFHNDEDARFLKFLKHDYEKELPEKSRKLILGKKEKLFLIYTCEVFRLSISKQHDYYERKLNELLKEMPDYVVKFVDAKQDIRSPLTLFNYERDYREFFNWLIAEGIVHCESFRDIKPEHLENIPLEKAVIIF
ncbi:hypothetical protein QUF81_00085 [Peribacillus simplex]|uniref:hypothetical protein n=1 Tax=Peribacillus simplex TaxID=1478 RepID=UPI0025A15B5C|nr:hypothetical protein [Peribacillus simplex]MDM5291701.1 hypothetical protein [Peribacillus simplex]